LKQRCTHPQIAALTPAHGDLAWQAGWLGGHHDTAAALVKAVTIPVQLWSSDPAQNADGLSGCCAPAINEMLPSKPDYHFVANARHFSFLATCTPAETLAIPRICTDAPDFDRVEFHKHLHAEAIAFFRKHLGESATP
jgi:predicted dienelactone hydrolase